MRKGIPILLSMVLALILCSCGTIRNHQILEQQSGTTLTTSIGGKIFRINKTGDLPNVVGGSDIWGGQVDKGYIDLRLVGIEGASLELEVLEVDRTSSETTLDRYNLRNNNALVAVDNRINIGNQESTKPYTIKFNTANQKELVFGDVKVIFVSIQPYSVQYLLEQKNH